MANKAPKPAKVINAPHKEELEAKKREIAEAEQADYRERANEFNKQLAALCQQFEVGLNAVPVYYPADPNNPAAGFATGARVDIVNAKK